MTKTTQDSLSKGGGLTPNSKRVSAKVRRLSPMLAVAGLGVVGVMVAVVLDGTLVRFHKKSAPATSVSSGGQSAGGDNAANSQVWMRKLRMEGETLPPPPPNPNPPSGNGKNNPLGNKANGLSSQSDAVNPTRPIVRQAWVQYVSGLIQQTQKLTDQRQRALVAGLAASSGGTGGAVGPVSATPASFSPSASSNPLAGMIHNSASGGLTPGGTDAGGNPVSFAGGSSGQSAALSAAQKSSYLGKLRGNPDYLATGREAPISPDVLRAGSVIPAVMETGIDSDLPGQILARVASNVYSTPDGSQVLVPQGAELIGTYDDQVSNGQSRVLVVWNRIIYPDGSSLDIDSMPGASPSGYAGFHDQVNNHYFRIFGDALLMSVFSAGIQLSQPQASPNSTYSSQQVVAGSLGQQLGQTGQNLINRDISIAPTLKIRQGYKFDVMITRDLVIKPWQSVSALSRAAGNDQSSQRHHAMWIAEPLQRNHLSTVSLAAGGRDGGANSKPRPAASAHPQSLMKNLPPRSTRPYVSGGATVVPSLPLPPNAAPVAQQAPVVPPPPPLPSWSLASGQLIGRQLATWAHTTGWHVVWNVSQDWPVQRPITFHGSFTGVASQVIRDLSADGAGIHATFYQGNRTLVVTGGGAGERHRYSHV